MLPDKTVSGLTLTQGKIMGLTNLLRSGEAFLEERPERVYLTSSIVVRDLTACYSWRRRKLLYIDC
jgi:hypothetical protein